MKVCKKCGGSLYKDFDTYCIHEFDEPPEPRMERVVASASIGVPVSRRELIWKATISQGRTMHTEFHPLKCEARRLAQDWWWRRREEKMRNLRSISQVPDKWPDVREVLGKVPDKWPEVRDLRGAGSAPRAARVGRAEKQQKRPPGDQ